MGWSDIIYRDDVKDARTFCSYAAQECGVPYPTKGDIFATERKIKEIFQLYPGLTWYGLCDIVVWAKQKKRRFPTMYQLINSFRWAYADGYLNEIDKSHSESLDDKIALAIQEETDPEWKLRLARAQGPGKKVVYSAWMKRLKL